MNLPARIVQLVTDYPLASWILGVCIVGAVALLVVGAVARRGGQR